jgi:hypothetical protein
MACRLQGLDFFPSLAHTLGYNSIAVVHLTHFQVIHFVMLEKKRANGHLFLIIQTPLLLLKISQVYACALPLLIRIPDISYPAILQTEIARAVREKQRVECDTSS